MDKIKTDDEYLLLYRNARQSALTTLKKLVEGGRTEYALKAAELLLNFQPIKFDKPIIVIEPAEPDE